MRDRERLRILILTRTDWAEPPRLRHQLTQLLLDAGYRPTFVQKPACVLPVSRPCRPPAAAVPGLTLLSAQELLHHQLRLVPGLHHLNAWFARRDLRHRLRSIGQHPPDLIINFNYDAFWLRSFCPGRPIITIINDDFESLSRLPVRRHLTWVLQRTCAMSTRVLTVSEMLRQRLARWCEPELFLPWAADAYRPPVPSGERRVLLFWGYVNERLDVAALQASLPELEAAGLRLRFVGPCDANGRQLQRLLGDSSAVEWRPACPFDALDTSDCLAALIPYRLDCPGVEAIQLSNKALQLLSL
ncbi:MAG: glycosyltransferase, partial [Cyanobium sp.]